MNEITCPVCRCKLTIGIESYEIPAFQNTAPPPVPVFKLVDIVSTLARRTPRTVPPGTRLGLVIHHSGTAMALKGSNPEAYARYHVETNKWPCIGYTAVVQPDGTAYRTLRNDEVGYHAGSVKTQGDENALYIGVCFSGDFDTETLPGAAMIAGAAPCRQLLVELGLDPATAPIYPHSHFSSKSCPGSRFPFLELCERIRKG